MINEKIFFNIFEIKVSESFIITNQKNIIFEKQNQPS